jgi:hypothetical protein
LGGRGEKKRLEEDRAATGCAGDMAKAWERVMELGWVGGEDEGEIEVE